VLRALFPEISQLKGVRQDPRYHPEGSAFEHTMMVVEGASRLSRHLERRERLKVMLAALFHDVGKLTTTAVTVRNGIEHISAHGHELESVRIADQSLRILEVSAQSRKHILSLIRYHMVPLEMSSNTALSEGGTSFDNRVRMLVRDVHPASFDSFVTLCRADQAGRLPAERFEERCKIIDAIERSARANGFIERPTARLLSGNTLESMGLSDSDDLYGHVIEEVERLRDREKIKTEQDAQRFVLLKYALPAELVEASGIGTPEQKRDFFIQYKKMVASGALSTVHEARRFLRDEVDAPFD